jgi:hypothetical protein
MQERVMIGMQYNKLKDTVLDRAAWHWLGSSGWLGVGRSGLEEVLDKPRHTNLHQNEHDYRVLGGKASLGP